MTSKKTFYIMIGVLGLLGVLIVVSVVLGDTFLKKQSGRLTSLKLDNQVIEAQQTSLAQARKDIQQYAELKTIAKQIVPQDKDQARATREILSLADQTGVKISSISFPASTLGTVPPKTTNTPDTTTTPVPKVTTPTVTQVKAVDGIKGLYQLDITVVSDTTLPATYSQLTQFLGKLEQNRRTAQVSQITIQPDTRDRTALNFTLIVSVYIKP